jgi:hypothetical protein
MHLNTVTPRTGITWVKAGIRAFWRQPLAMSGLFFMFMAAMSVAGVVPYLGSALALALLPAATLGLMAASKEADGGKFPMPVVLVSAFRAGRTQGRAMLQLGAMYAVGFLMIMALTTLVDGGQFARLYLVGGSLSMDKLQTGGLAGHGFVPATLDGVLACPGFGALAWRVARQEFVLQLDGLLAQQRCLPGVCLGLVRGVHGCGQRLDALDLADGPRAVCTARHAAHAGHGQHVLHLVLLHLPRLVQRVSVKLV